MRTNEPADDAASAAALALWTDWIRSILREKGISGTDLARSADVAPSTILRPLSDPDHRFLPAQRTIRKIAEAAGREPPEGLRPDRPAAPQPRTSPSAATVRHVRPADEVPIRRLGPLQNRDADRTVPAPRDVASDPEAFAFRVPDSGLHPFVRPGSLAFATTGRDASVDDIVLVVGRDGGARIRLMKGFSGDDVLLATATDEHRVRASDVAELAVVLHTTHG